VARRGSILITTKRRTVASQLVDKAIEIREFGPIPGAKFLLHSLGMVLDESDEEFRVAIDLSKKLSGHALAISQMAAFIKARQLVLKDFEHLYDKCKKRIHRERKAGWKYIGYTDALDTVWLLSFKSLNSDDRLCLGAFSYLAPDFIPTMLLEVLDKNGELPALRFFSDDFA
jgi:hypothetical protein